MLAPPPEPVRDLAVRFPALVDELKADVGNERVELLDGRVPRVGDAREGEDDEEEGRGRGLELRAAQLEHTACVV